MKKQSQNKPNQTQFAKRQEMSATVYFTKNYDDEPPWGSKSNQTRAGIAPNPPLVAVTDKRDYLPEGRPCMSRM